MDWTAARYVAETSREQLPPSKEYLDAMIKAAELYELDAEYIKKLREQPTSSL